MNLILVYNIDRNDFRFVSIGNQAFVSFFTSFFNDMTVASCFGRLTSTRDITRTNFIKHQMLTLSKTLAVST